MSLGVAEEGKLMRLGSMGLPHGLVQCQDVIKEFRGY